MSRGELSIYFYTRSYPGMTWNPVKKITKAIFGRMMAVVCFGTMKTTSR